jgi:hypothetical protein
LQAVAGGATFGAVWWIGLMAQKSRQTAHTGHSLEHSNTVVQPAIADIRCDCAKWSDPNNPYRSYGSSKRLQMCRTAAWNPNGRGCNDYE